MGYESTMDTFELKFVSFEKAREYFRKEEEITYDCPLNGNIANREDILLERELNIELFEHTGKFYDAQEWAPFIANLISGEITFYGEEEGDIWKLKFKGNGKVEYYEAEINFKYIDEV